MPNVENIKERLNKISIINEERHSQSDRLSERIDSLYSNIQSTQANIETNEFISRTLADYYKIVRKENLQELSSKISEYMESLLSKPYKVEMDIVKRGNYDYLNVNINGVEPMSLSGGEKQVYSLLMLAESTSQPIMVLDETLNSLDPITLERVLEYLNQLSDTHQIFFIELDDNLEIEYDYIAEEGGIVKWKTKEIL